jgi:hypothetical protein
MEDPIVKLEIDTAELREAVDRALAESLGDHFDPDRPLAIGEAKAAEMLCLAPHQLAELRRRGLVRAAKAGRGYRYSKKHLLDFLHGPAADGCGPGLRYVPRSAGRASAASPAS